MTKSADRVSLFKRRSTQTYYVAYYKDGKRHYISTGAKRKTEALAFLTHFRDTAQERSREITLDKFVADFLEYAKATYAYRTYLIYEGCLRRLKRIAGNICLVDITAAHYDMYKAKRTKERSMLGQAKRDHPVPKEQIKPATVNIELRALRAAFNTARRWRLLESNPFHDTSMVLDPERVPLFFSPANVSKLLEAIDDRCLRDLVIFASLTGMRRSEAVNVRWSAVDLDRKLVNIQSGATFKTKAGKRRTIPLNETALSLIRSRIGISSSDYVFTRNGKPVTPDWLTHHFKLSVRKAGLDERLHFHSLRHTFASWLVQEGVLLYSIQKLLGHSSPSTTQIYSHLQIDQLHDTVNKISIPMNREEGVPRRGSEESILRS